ncbi:MAG: hypothetical protein FJ294_08160 [Planctomycetes bacterium]|nr:hypothetical protein [Planctomycetota bacterium]
MNALHWIVSLASLLAPFTQAPLPAAGLEGCVAVETVAPETVAAASRDWVAKSTDSVVGLKEASQVSNPAVVDWQALLEATPEMRKLRSEKIAADSPEGIQLLTEAANRATTACENLRASRGYCSVWKSIRHKDGRAVADITDLVKAQL